jgi:predicted nucleic acid-binding protein
VTRYLLDTNIVSEATKPRVSQPLADWLDRQADTDLFIVTLTIAEIWRGILEMAPGRRRRDLEAWFYGSEGPQALFGGRVLPFDEAAAFEWARIMAAGTEIGRPRSPIDMVIAATAAANGCTVVTANDRDFRGAVDCLNPMDA